MTVTFAYSSPAESAVGDQVEVDLLKLQAELLRHVYLTLNEGELMEEAEEEEASLEAHQKLKHRVHDPLHPRYLEEVEDPALP